MNMLNSVILEGRLIEIKKFQDRLELTLETERDYYKDSEGVIKDEVETVVEKFTSEVYGQMMSHVEKVETGRCLRIVGRLSERKWKDLDGETHFRIVIVSEHLEIKPKKNIKNKWKGSCLGACFYL